MGCGDTLLEALPSFEFKFESLPLLLLLIMLLLLTLPVLVLLLVSVLVSVSVLMLFLLLLLLLLLLEELLFVLAFFPLTSRALKKGETAPAPAPEAPCVSSLGPLGRGDRKLVRRRVRRPQLLSLLREEMEEGASSVGLVVASCCCSVCVFVCVCACVCVCV